MMVSTGANGRVWVLLTDFWAWQASWAPVNYVTEEESASRDFRVLLIMNLPCKNPVGIFSFRPNIFHLRSSVEDNTTLESTALSASK